MDIETIRKQQIGDLLDALQASNQARDILQVRAGEMAAEIERLQSIIDEANAQEPLARGYKNSMTGTCSELYWIGEAREGETNLYARPIPAQQSCAECGNEDKGLALYCVKCIDAMGDSGSVSVTSMAQAALDELGPYATALSENQWHRAMHAAKGAKPLPQGAQAEFVRVLTLNPSDPVNFTVMQTLANLKTEVLGLQSPVYAIQLIERIEAEQQSPAVAVHDDVLVLDKGILEDVKCDLERLQDDCLTSFNLDSQERALKHVKTRIEEITKIISAVLKPNESEAICTQCGFVGAAKDHQENSCYYETFKLIAALPSPRITEQDAREIVVSAWRHWNVGGGRTFNTFIEEEGRALLDKLNDKSDSVGGSDV